MLSDFLNSSRPLVIMGKSFHRSRVFHRKVGICISIFLKKLMLGCRECVDILTTHLILDNNLDPTTDVISGNALHVFRSFENKCLLSDSLLINM